MQEERLRQTRQPRKRGRGGALRGGRLHPECAGAASRGSGNRGSGRAAASVHPRALPRPNTRNAK
eukprot:57857-Pyramimonas_sp.AAC.1